MKKILLARGGLGLAVVLSLGFIILLGSTFVFTASAQSSYKEDFEAAYHLELHDQRESTVTVIDTKGRPMICRAPDTMKDPLFCSGPGTIITPSKKSE